MKQNLLILVIIVILICAGISIKNRRETAQKNAELNELSQEELDEIVQSLDDNFEDITKSLNEDINDIEKSLNEDISQNLSIESETALYNYTSGDSNAAKGNPELLYVYSIDDNEMNFKYHAVWNENDIKGTAKNIGENTYIYEYDNDVIKFELNAAGKDSIKVSEYQEGKEEASSFVNLWK